MHVCPGMAGVMVSRYCVRHGIVPMTGCPVCKLEKRRLRGTTTSRGLGWEHQKRRAAGLPFAYGRLCALCGEVMLEGQPLDLDHSTPRAHDPASVGDRFVHASCNRSAGGRTRRLPR